MPEIDNLEQRIDVNQQNGMEIQEIIKFSQNEKNVKELGDRLNNFINGLDKQKNQKFVDAVYKATICNSDFQYKIAQKIRYNEQLSQSEVFLLYLQSLVDSLCYDKPFIAESGNFYCKFCGYQLLHYIQLRYSNYSYQFKENTFTYTYQPPQINLKKNTSIFQTPQTNEISLPNDIDFSTFGENNTYMPREFNKLDKWAIN